MNGKVDTYAFDPVNTNVPDWWIHSFAASPRLCRSRSRDSSRSTFGWKTELLIKNATKINGVDSAEASCSSLLTLY